MASPKALRWYLLLTGLTLPLRELRPGPNLIHAIEEAGKDVGPVFDTAAIAGDQYARMVCWAHGASIGAYLRSVLLHNRTDYSEGLWINCPAFCREDVRRLYFEDTPLLERLVSPNAVGQGKRWVDYLSRVPLILSTDPFTVPAGAAMFRGVQSVILGE
jgi:hypothetical protein